MLPARNRHLRSNSLGILFGGKLPHTTGRPTERNSTKDHAARRTHGAHDSIRDGTANRYGGPLGALREQ
eukprot:8831922-Alexandrium_andersonii.AAC.1